jgi:hypothetical protein
MKMTLMRSFADAPIKSGDRSGALESGVKVAE